MSAARLICEVEDPSSADCGSAAVHIVYPESARFDPATGCASVVLTVMVVPPFGPEVKMSYSRYTREGFVSART